MEGLTITPVSKSSQLENWSIQWRSNNDSVAPGSTINETASASALNKIILKMEEARRGTNRSQSSSYFAAESLCSSSTKDCSVVSSSMPNKSLSSSNQSLTSSKQLFARFHLNRNGNLPVLADGGASVDENGGKSCQINQKSSFYSNGIRKTNISSLSIKFKMSKNSNGIFPRRASCESVDKGKEEKNEKENNSSKNGFKETVENRLSVKLLSAEKLSSSSKNILQVKCYLYCMYNVHCRKIVIKYI